MHVGLNCVFLTPGEVGGMEVYARALIPRLAALPDTDVTVFVGREAAWEALGAPVRVLPVTASNRLDWVRGEQQLGWAARGCDVVHSLASTAPWWGPSKRLVTVHDLHYRLVPDTHFGLRGLGMRVLVPQAVRTADRVIVDAASTREDLAEHLGTDRAKVDVVPLAGGGAPEAPVTSEDEVRARFDLGDRRLLLTVSAKRPHKNLLRLLEALATLPAPRPVLVLPGYPTPHEQELRARAAALGILEDVRFPAWVSGPDLEGLYAAADLFVFPSLYEGFGLPVLEAMARGVPVATSGRASLAEVAGDAALLFDPESVQAISDALRQLLGDPVLRERLRTAGRQQAARFTWDRTARSTRDAYERALSG